MDALDLEGWPADRTLALSGRAGALKLPVTLRNRSDRPISIAEASLAEVRLGADGASLREHPVPVGLVAPAGRAIGANIRLRLDPATPPGRYHGEVRLGGLSRPVEIEVIQDVRLAIRPAPVVVDTTGGRAQRLDVAFENRGNTPLTLDLTGRYPLGEEVMITGERLAPAGDGAHRIADLVNQALGGGPRPVLVEAGSVELSMPEGPAALAPGAALALPLEIALPETLSPTGRYHVFAPVYASELHIVVVTAAKPAVVATPRPRRTKGDEG
jgi:hypothetical protein